MLHTRFTHDYGVDHPLISAGMAFLAVPELAAAVSNAGGLGLIGAGAASPPETQALIRAVRVLTTRPFGVNFLVDTTAAFGPFTVDDHIDVCIAERVSLVVFHWNLPPTQWIQRLHGAGARVWIQVGSVDEARAAATAGADALIAQGNEAGGHCRSNVGLVTLVPQIIDAVRPLPVFAAGGIADGRGVAAALSLGAEAVVIGTRFIASEEANAHTEYKRRVVDARPGDVTRTWIFGVEWPDQAMKVLVNRVVREWAGRNNRTPEPEPGRVIGHLRRGEVELPMPQFSAFLPTRDTTGDLEEMCLPAGESASLVRSIEPAAKIVGDMMAEAEAVLRGRVSEMLRG